MLRLVAVALAVAACSIGADDRPRTAEYATMAILSPNCTGAACHSAFAGNDNIAFDTLDGARKALTSLIQLDSTKNDRDDPVNADIIIWTTQIDPKMLHIGRMPYDRPLAIEDENYLIDLVRTGVKDAQCNPEQARVCNNTEITTCTSSWNFGDVLGVCGQLAGTTSKCSGGVCVCDQRFGDCNHEMLPDGCEVRLDTDGNCGGCGVFCDPDPMTPTDRVCRDTYDKATKKLTGVFACQCPVGFDECDNDPTTLCETAINTNASCGACGVSCGTGKTCMPVAGAAGVFACQ